MKNLILLFCSFLFLSGTIFSQELPKTFKIEEYMVSIGTDFKITNINGYVDQEIISLTSNFTLKLDGTLVSVAKQHFISIGSKIDIFDGKGKKIGMIEESIFDGLFTFGIYSKYIIYDASGKKVAQSEKHQLMDTEFSIKDMSGSTICTISRPWINLMSDTWTVKFLNDTFDKRLIVFIPCYKTHRDNQSND